ncbi:deoxyribonuclease-2-beta-like isoform X2 [Perca fluviatilis]|uniref:deoxyribonuclease-2-beta-like isoform X2 n=1 Tax=Perca fluviatilis TaxID=8168 RepID=UPI001965E766|nr:deoxyribonuclease-2-beta-like isoform X2 [Perca fluviatilis]
MNQWTGVIFILPTPVTCPRYIIYKAPKLNNIGTTGLEYIYIDPNGKKKETLTTDLTYKPINHPNGVLANTLRPIFTTSMTDNFGFISYSDQPPGCNAQDKFGHSKGVVMMNKTTGVWLLHSVPQFPFLRDQNNFYPPSGVKNAQTFICVTFNYEEFNMIGEHLLDINAFTFEDHIPNNFYESLQKLRRTGNNIRKERLNGVRTQDLTSAGRTPFHSFAKYKIANTIMDTDPKRFEGDLYVTIAKEYQTNVRVQTWPCKQDEPYCVTNQHQVINIESVKTNLGTWGSGNDHSKWCVATDTIKNKFPLLICIADVNRALSQYKRPGGALCFIHKEASELFKGLINQTDACSVKRPRPRDPACDPDSE